MTLKDLLFLPGNARFADFGLLLLRIATGVFLIYQSHDNVFSAAPCLTGDDALEVDAKVRLADVLEDGEGFDGAAVA